MNVKTHLNTRLKRINTLPELLRFMSLQGFVRESGQQFHCVVYGMKNLVVTINKINGSWTVTDAK